MFKTKRTVPFVLLEQINEELDRLVKTEVLSKPEYSEWAVPTVYVKKKSKEIRICADFSTFNLNTSLKESRRHICEANWSEILLENWP